MRMLRYIFITTYGYQINNFYINLFYLFYVDEIMIKKIDRDITNYSLIIRRHLLLEGIYNS